MQWVMIATAPNEPIAETWVGLLRDHGIPALVRQESVLRIYLGSMTTPVAVLTPEDRQQEGKQILEEILGHVDKLDVGL